MDGSTPGATVSHRARRFARAVESPLEFFTRSVWAGRRAQPGVADFAFGSPHEMPLPGVVNALREWSQPLTRDWFGYRTSDQDAQAEVVTLLRDWYGLPFSSGDVALTNGGMAALALALHAVADSGEEVIVSLPAWFHYEPLIVAAGLRPVLVQAHPVTFDLDLDAIVAAITPRTRVVVVNSPHNPTGRIYTPELLRELAARLDVASAGRDRPIVILSDEPYRKLALDGCVPASPVQVYGPTLVAYSYSKVLLIPGERLGFLAVSPGMPSREELQAALVATQIAHAWAFPNTVLQHALADLNRLSISVPRLQRKRDRLAAELRAIGYELLPPEGTFYMLVRSPWDDDEAFVDLLADHGVLVMPGRLFHLPGWFRVSLTASDDMLERGLTGFASAWRAAQFATPSIRRVDVERRLA
jgi:aspartate aminotransferase